MWLSGHGAAVSAPLVQPCMRYNAWPRTRSVSVASAAEGEAPGVESPVVFGARTIELGTKFMLDTLAHAAVRCRVRGGWGSALCSA